MTTCAQAFASGSTRSLTPTRVHRTDVHDTQGPRDEGVDVQLSYEDGGQHRVGLQIKSFDEIEAWAKKRDREFMQRLKAQYATAMQNAKVEDYYVLLCTDEIEHKEQLRLICSEMKQFDQLKIVLPRQALALYDSSEAEIQAHVTRLLCKGDRVLEAALRAIAGMPADRAFMLLALICRAFAGHLNVSQEDVSEIYQEWEEFNPGLDPGGERLADIVWELDGSGLSMSEGDDGFTIEIAHLPTPLCAMYFDQKLRCGGDPLTSLATLLGVGRKQRRRLGATGARERG